MREFWTFLNSGADKILQLPTKFVDTRFLILVQFIVCLIIYSAVLVAQMSIVDRCVVPLPSSFINK